MRREALRDCAGKRSDGSCGLVLGVTVAVADLGSTVAIGVEAEHGGEHTPDGESRKDEEDDRGHGSKSMTCEILPKVAE